MSFMDPRTQYLTNVIRSLLNIEDQAYIQRLQENGKLDDFLNNTQEKQIALYFLDGKGFQLYNPQKTYEQGQVVSIIKNKSEVIRIENITSQLNIQLLPFNAVQVLPNQLEFFKPLLASNMNLKHLSDQLYNGLLDNKDQDLNNTDNILKPSDEFDVWFNLVQSPNSEIQQRASFFHSMFAKIDKWRSIEQVSPNQLIELIDLTADNILQIWNKFNNKSQSYPPERLQKLVEVMGQQLVLRMSLLFKQSEQLWDINQTQNRFKLNETIRILQYFESTLSEYIYQFFNQSNRFKLKLDFSQCQMMIARAKELLTLRTLFEELTKIQFCQNNFKADVANIFSPLKQIEAGNIYACSQDQFKQVQFKVNASIEEQEDLLINILKNDILSQCSKENPIQTMKECQQWNTLLNRTNIKQQLFNERQIILQSFQVSIDKLRDEFESRSGQSIDPIIGMESVPCSKYFSKNLNEIVWSNQIIAKIKKISQAAENTLQDLNNYQNFTENQKNMLQQLNEFKKEKFESWKQAIIDMLRQKNSELFLQSSGKMMEINSDGYISVNYSQRLVLLIKETRQFIDLGFKKQIGEEILELVENAKKYQKDAINLKQIANYFNTMKQQIIPSQQKMIVNEAINFENVIKNVDNKNSNQNQLGKITWESTIALEQYIQRVTKACSIIKDEITRLRQVHMRILQEVMSLFQVSLVKNKNQWNKKLDVIQNYIQIGMENKNRDLGRHWLVHWDYQLYKVLENAYQQGLQEFYNDIEMNIELVVQFKNIQFKPPIEQVKEKYFKQIQQFIVYPNEFKGVGGLQHLFKEMPEQNAKYLAIVYAKAQQLFQDLKQLSEQYYHYTSLFFLNVSQVNISALSDWEYNINLLKKKRKDLEKEQESVKIQGFNVSLSPFKQSVNERIQQIIEELINKLKDQVIEDAQEIDDFIKKSNNILQTKPQNMEEIQAASEQYMELLKEKRQYQEKLTALEKKNRLLQSLGESGSNILNLQKNWENFMVSFENFDETMKTQQKEIKNQISENIQNTNNDVQKFYTKWSNLRPKQNTTLDQASAKEIAVNIKEWRIQWQDLEKKMEKLAHDCEHFELESPQFGNIKQIQNDLDEQDKVWGIFDQYNIELENLEKEEWLAMSGKHDFQDFYLKWTDTIKKLHQSGERTMVTEYINSQNEQHKKIYPMLKLCQGNSFEKEHWREMFILLKLDGKVEDLKFGQILEKVDVMIKKEQELKHLAARAQGEVTLKESIQELKIWCETAVFELTVWKSNNRTTPIIKEWKDLMTKVSDNQSLLASLKESKFIGRFQDQVDGFEIKLGGMDEYLTKLNQIQRKWVYLEPIFTRGALPQEQQRFRRLDDEYRNIMQTLERDAKVVSLTLIGGIKDTLDNIIEQLDRCQKALNDYLEVKRNAFPRFYFLGDDDLLEILGQSQNPQIIQLHLKKLFAGIFKVNFSDDSTRINYIVSQQGESVKLNREVQIEEMVENWLTSLNKHMVVTLQDLLRDNLAQQKLSLNDFPSQIIQITEEIRFGKKSMSAIQNQTLPSLKQELDSTLSSLTQMISNSKPLQLLTLQSLILDIIHNINIINLLIEKKVTAIDDWFFFKQLKYLASNDCQMQICDGLFDYTFEYQGNTQKLVHTPLTDKCYLVLTQAMHMGFGGNPYGPAGTGKTESVKALASAFGRQCLVFNCDEALDYKSMGRIFVGLVKCGAWGCFDEFNRLLEEQLSAISQQIQVIQWAIKNKEPFMELLEKQIEVNKNAGIFVTLNPAGKGYGGRSKLPDNLKQLFRPVAMSAPDNSLIASTLLYSEGFIYADELAEKIVSVFELSKQLLTVQQHYDWGLRALKTILRVAGALIQQERKQSKEISKDTENELLIKSIRVNTLSKLTFEDKNKFTDLVSDVFPGITSKDIQYDELINHCKEHLKENNMQIVEQQIQKIIQFYEACKQRIGVVLVGPSGCGKTTIWKALKKGHEKMGKQVKTYIINPKSMSRQQLLGYMNNDTREFTEGVLTNSARLVVKDESQKDTLHWIICDGDIDPEWIESLNSVLDDNHLLTLPTGERISFGENVNFIFETNNLQFASPATVSRMGMIFLNNEDISIQAVVHKWLTSQPADVQPKLKDFLDYMFTLLDKIKTLEANQQVQTTQIGIVMNVLSQINKVESKIDFVYSLIQGFCSNLNFDMRDEMISDILQTTNSQSWTKGVNILLENGRFTDPQNIPTDIADLSDFDAFPPVFTKSLQTNVQIIKNWINNNDSIVICGESGTGKSILIRAVFAEIQNNQKVNLSTIYCNAQTTSLQVIQKLNQVCSKKNFSQGKILYPKDCSKLVIYLKDINLPKPDKYKTIQLIAFLQQLISHKGYYDESLEFIHIDNRIQIICSMTPASTVGRHVLDSRFTGNVRILCLQQQTNQELEFIYSQYSQNIIKAKDLSLKTAQVLVEYQQNITKQFNQDEQRHYIFNCRNISHILFNLQKYQLNDQQAIANALFNENRMFKNKLVSVQEKNKLDSIIQGIIRKHFGNCETDLSYLYINNQLEPLSKDNLFAVINQNMITYQREYNNQIIYLLPEITELIISLHQSISLRNNILLAGRSGVGRKAAVRMVSIMLRKQLLQPYCTKDYSVREFKKELKTFFEIAGAQDKQIVLLIEDQNLLQKEFLEILNSLISSGEIPGLFTQDELEVMCQGNDSIKNEYYGKNLYESFCLRIKKNVQVVLCLDHSQDNFQYMCASNPSLYNRCVVIWLENWSNQSMKVLQNNELKEIFEKVDKKDVDSIQNLSIQMQKDSLNKKLGSPSTFFNQLYTYKKLYNDKINSRGDQSAHLKMGLNKLIEAKTMVDELSIEAQRKQKLVIQKQKEADDALQKISISMKQAATSQNESEQLRQFLEKEQEKVKVQRNQVNQEKAQVQPLLDQAQVSVQGISKDNISFLTSLNQPVDSIKESLQGILAIFGMDNPSWKDTKRFLANRQVKEQLVEFKPEQVTSVIRKKVKKVIDTYPNSFRKEVIHKASPAAEAMVDWLLAIIQYSEVLERIQPLQQQIDALDDKLRVQINKQKEVTKKLTELEEEVKTLQNYFAMKTQEAGQLKAELQQAQDILSKAQDLLDKLGDEKVRWQEQANNIEKEFANYPLDCLLSAGYICYLSKQDENYREEFLNQWKSSVNKQNYNFTKFLSQESEILQWKKAGLPSDLLSLENYIMIKNSYKVSLLIDPNIQATQFLKDYQQTIDKNVQIINSHDTKFSTTFELAVKFGKTLIVTEVDNINPLIIPVLRRDITLINQRLSINIGDKVVDYADTFKLYLATRNSDIDLPPHIDSLVQSINFTVTKSGLEGKLLSIIINNQQPELETKKQQCLENEESLKISLSKLEQQLLEELANSKDNILKNTALIEQLNQTKIQSIQIQSSLEESHKLQIDLDQQREVYKQLAQQGASLFILIKKLQNIQKMYTFSLKYFIFEFSKCLNTQDNTFPSIEQKIQFCKKQLNKIILNAIQVSLFKEDKLMFTISMHKQMFPQSYQNNEWSFILGQYKSSTQKQQVPKWIALENQEMFHNYNNNLTHLQNKLNINDQKFIEWVQNSSSDPLPLKNVSEIQQQLITLVFKPHTIINSLQSFLSQQFNVTSISSSLSIKKVFQLTDNVTPILFIVSAGSDPSEELQEYVQSTRGLENYKQLSMGGGQNQIAIDTLKECADKGLWCCLKNLHLVTPWLGTLENTIKQLNPHEDFKLILTSEPHDKFPSILLESCFKISYQNPPGVKRNLMKIYEQWGQEYIQKGSSQRSQVLFILALFHAIIQERRTYIPQGWNKFYEFSYGDLKAGTIAIDNLMKDTNKVNFETLYGLFENTIYGGRIDGEFDVVILRSYLETMFNQKVMLSQEQIPTKQFVPISSNMKEYKKLIQDLNEIDHPSLFYLPASMDKAVQRSNYNELQMKLQQLQYSSDKTEKFDKEEWGQQLQVLFSAYKDSIQSLSLGQVKSNVNSDPVVSFIYNEYNNCLVSLKYIQKNMNYLNKVLYQNELLTNEIYQLGKQLLINQIPDSWYNIMDSGKLPQEWITSFGKKVNAVVKIVDRCKSPSFLNDQIQLSDLFHPETFINAVKQKAARNLKVPLNKIQFITSFEPLSNEIVLNLKNIMIQGSDVQDNQLIQQQSNSQESIPVKQLFIGFGKENESDGTDFPLFRDATREKLLMRLRLKCANGKVNERILSGTALFLGEQ